MYGCGTLDVRFEIRICGFFLCIFDYLVVSGSCLFRVLAPGLVK